MILMYHNIAEEVGFNTISRRMFVEQVRFVIDTRRIVSLDAYARSLARRADIDRCAVLSIDDGYASFRTEVLPILERYAIPAVLFVPVNHVGGTNSWEKAGSPVFNLLPWDELAELSRHELVTIGSHGFSHSSLRMLPRQEQHNEIVDSRRILEDRTGSRITHFSYPFGQRIDFTEEISDIVSQNGYDSACSTLYGRSNGDKDRYRLRRIEVRPRDSIDRLKTHVETNLHLVFIKQRIKEIVHQLPVRGR